MPHLRIEYSGNLEDRVDFSAFCQVMHKCIINSGLFAIAAVRVRTFRANHYVIADQLPENSFIDLQFSIAEGREPHNVKQVGDLMFKAATEYLASLFDTPHFALSFQITEMDSNLSWKKNAMHARLRKP